MVATVKARAMTNRNCVKILLPIGIFISGSPRHTWIGLFHAMKNSVRVRAHVYIGEDEMDKFHGYVKSHTLTAFLLSAGILCAGLSGAKMLRAQSASSSPAAQLESAMLADFRRVEVASVSDALEELTGKRMYMTHRMHPIFTTKFAGFARTVQLKKDEGNADPSALSGMLAAIDQGSVDAVYVMVVEDGEDI